MLRHYIEAHPTGDDRPNPNLAHFPEAWDDFVKLFDEEDFLNRNPEIKEKVNG
jgi:hypothetical protein